MKSKNILTEKEKKKIMNAYCPQKTEIKNPILQIYKLVIFPSELINEIRIEREEKYGGNKTYKNYEELKYDYMNSQIYPLDLKQNLIKHLSIILEPIRNKMREDENK